MERLHHHQEPPELQEAESKDSVELDHQEEVDYLRVNGEEETILQVQQGEDMDEEEALIEAGDECHELLR
jgi:hypothetical protein